MRTKFQVTFILDGYVENKSIQLAETATEAIRLARLYHPVPAKAQARAIPVADLNEEDEL